MVSKQLTKLIYLFIILFIGALAAVFLAWPGGDEKSAPAAPIPVKSHYRIGILQSADTPEEEKMRRGFLDALAAKGYSEGGKIEVETAVGSGDQPSMDKAAQALAGGKKDLIAFIGNEAGASLGPAVYSTPLVGMGIINFKEQPWLEGHENITGMNSIPSMLTQLSTAKRIMKAQRVGILYSEADEDSKTQLDWLRAAAERKHMALYEVMVKKGESPEEKAKAFLGQAESVYIAEDHQILKHFDKVMQVLDGAKIPVIGADEHMVRKGALVSVSEDYYRMGFSAGLMAAKLLKGGILPDEIPISRQKDTELVVNMEAAKKLGIELPNDIWQRARKLYLYTGQPARP